MAITALICILLWSFLPVPSDGYPRFTKTPQFNLTSGYLSYVPENASSFTLSWDYDSDGNKVKYVELKSNVGLQARRFTSQPIWQINKTSRYYGRVIFSGRATVTVSHITRNDSGEYTCTVFFDSYYGGSSMRTSISLLVAGAPRRVVTTLNPPLWDEQLDPVVVDLNQKVSTIYCNDDGLPPVSYYWKLNGYSLNKGNQGSKTLTITKAKVKDAGNYTCVARNTLGSKESTPFVVNVNYLPSVTTFTTGTSDNTVVQGTNVTLTCSADGYPPPTYIIRRGMTSLVQQSRTGKHVISNVQLSAEEETFFCMPSNKLGRGPTKKLKITVHAPPTFPAQTLESTIKGPSVRYSCTAEAKPAAEIMWTLNGKILANLPPYSISATVIPIPRSKLFRTIGYLMVDKTDDFSCIAINDAGKVSLAEASTADHLKDKGLSAGGISGIVIAILILLLIIVALIVYIRRLKKQAGENREQSQVKEDRCAFANEEQQMSQREDIIPERT